MTNSTTNACDSTCVGLAVGLSLAAFLLGCLLIWHYRDSIKPSDDESEPNSLEEFKKGASNKNSYDEETPVPMNKIPEKADHEGLVGVQVTTTAPSLRTRKNTSNKEGIVDVAEIILTSSKRSSNNDRPVDPAEIARPIKKSNNERPVDSGEVGKSASRSNNEVAVDGETVKPALRGSRRTSSNNDRPIDISELEQKANEPTPAELEAAKKRAESLERRLEDMTKVHSTLTEHAKKLQQEIAELSSKNNDMQLDRL